MIVELTSYQQAWLKSIAKDGPTRLCVEGVERALLRKGLLRKLPDGRAEVTDAGHQIVAAITGKASFFNKVTKVVQSTLA